MDHYDDFRPDAYEEYDEFGRLIRRSGRNESESIGRSGNHAASSDDMRRRVTHTDGTPANTQRRVRTDGARTYQDAADAAERQAASRQRAAQNAQRTVQNGQRTVQSGQRTAQSGQRTAQSGQRSAQDAARRAAQNGQRTAQNAQRTAQDAARRAAQSGQRTVQNGQRTAQNGQRTAQNAQRTAQNAQRVSVSPRRTTVEEARRREDVLSLRSSDAHAPRTRAEGGTAGDEMNARRSASAARNGNAVRSGSGSRGGHSGSGNGGRGGSGSGNRNHGGSGHGGHGNGGNGHFDGPDYRRRDGKPVTICKVLAIEMFVMVAAAAVFFIAMLMRSRMLNTKFSVLAIAVCAAICAVVAFLGWTHAYKQNITKTKQRAAFIASVAVSVLFTIFFIIGGVYIMKTVSTIRNVGGVTREISNYHVYVLEDDPAERLADAADYTFGILASQDRENVDQIVDDIEEELGSQITVAEYPGLTGLADALNGHEIGAMILGETFLDMFENFEGYETFADTIRSIWTGTVETEIETVPEELHNIVTIYISGSDTRESTLPTRSLSDVNLIMRMNLDTHQILIISTPRDYYVQTSVSGGAYDKLTHAGAYGVQCSMDTLSMLYGIDIDYYVRLNFVGFCDIIDALGGVDVWSDNTFTTGNMIGYTIWEGWNHMDGATALAYSRERYAFADGDNQRGRNQMEVLKGIINACTSPQILANYMNVLDSVDGCFETSIPYSVMSDLVRYQLDYGGDWDMITYSVYGEGASQPTFSSQSYAFVFIPDMNTVNVASDLLNRMAAGEVISDPNAGE